MNEFQEKGCRDVERLRNIRRRLADPSLPSPPRPPRIQIRRPNVARKSTGGIGPQPQGEANQPDADEPELIVLDSDDTDDPDAERSPVSSDDEEEEELPETTELYTAMQTMVKCVCRRYVFLNMYDEPTDHFDRDYARQDQSSRDWEYTIPERQQPQNKNRRKRRTKTHQTQTPTAITRFQVSEATVADTVGIYGRNVFFNEEQHGEFETGALDLISAIEDDIALRERQLRRREMKIAKQKVILDSLISKVKDLTKTETSGDSDSDDDEPPAKKAKSSF